MERVRDYLKGYKKQFVWGPFFKLLEAIFELLLPLLMAKIIDEAIAHQDKPLIIRYGLYMVALSISGYIFSLICQYFASVASQGVGTTSRNRLYHHINALTQEQVQHLGANTLTTRLTSDINQIQLAVAMLIRLAIRAPFIVLGSILLALSIDVKITMIFVVVMIAVATILWISTKLSVPFYTKIQATLDHLTLVLSENITGARVIRAFSRQDKEQKRFNEVSDEVKRKQIRVGKIIALVNPSTYFMVNMGIIMVLYFGGYQVNVGVLSAGEVIALVNYLTQIFLAMVVLASILIIFTRGLASAKRINDVLAIQPSFSEGVQTYGDREASYQLEFNHVDFQYEDANQPFIQDLSFKLRKGETLGIIGGTGSGKTCVANLLSRLFDASAGEVLFEGHSIKEYTYKYLRENISLVPQKSVLLTGSIAFNLTMGREDVLLSDLDAAIENAQAQFVRSLPAGLETPLEQGGRNLSGGQRQRLSIARALVQQPQVLILDDSSSALDYATDAALRKALAALEMTKIMISQRISSIKHADHILVLEGGKMVGYGTHDELIEQCLLYQEIQDSQQSKERDDDE